MPGAPRAKPGPARRPRPCDDPRVTDARVRIDKWLWAARFFKTRSLATEAVQGGRVQVEGQRVKPARDVRIGEILEITIGQEARTVIVRALADKRGPASVAALLYDETPESVARRERRSELRRLAPPPGADLHGRPSKRDRRRIEALRAAQRRGF
jgi:ribosome-associated heat shock protein Hsp15